MTIFSGDIQGDLMKQILFHQRLHKKENDSTTLLSSTFLAFFVNVTIIIKLIFFLQITQLPFLLPFLYI
jgi:hypothetical protein